mmetsp:Transcript_39481/g.85945  ORF Transcript_39481/g.85945 Transcript_39481/m.85945 type:complete len:332 (+) Transcript_39481:2515-3510(+)
MFTTHTSTQITAITLARKVPNSSSFFLRGVISSDTSTMAEWMRPMAVRPPVAATTARARPTVITVPLNSMHVLSWYTAWAVAQGLRSLRTESLSPVRMAWSHRSCELKIWISRASLGTLPPTATSTTSPGTSSAAGTTRSRLPRTTVARSACRILSSSMAFSALVSVITPTAALATRMSTMTNGSTNPSQPSPSNTAKRNEITAEAIRIFTSKSSNCFSTNFQKGTPSSGGISLRPNLSRRLEASSSVSPVFPSTSKCDSTSSAVRTNASSITPDPASSSSLFMLHLLLIVQGGFPPPAHSMLGGGTGAAPDGGDLCQMEEFLQARTPVVC